MQAAPAPDAHVPIAFLVATFTVAAVVAILIAYYGIHGQLGWGIP